MRHQVDIRWHMRDIVSQHKIHRHVIAAYLRVAVTDGDPVSVGQAVLGEDLSSVCIDDDLIDLFHSEQRVENPAEQGLAAEISEVFTLDPHAVGLHGQQSYDSIRLKVHGFDRNLLVNGFPLERVG